MPSKSVLTLLSVVVAVYMAMLLIGFFVLQQILLSVYVATALLLVGAVVYVAWRYLGGSNETRDSQSL